MAQGSDNPVGHEGHEAPPRYQAVLVVLGSLVVFVIGVILVLAFAIR
jgi:hypothetical protein